VSPNALAVVPRAEFTRTQCFPRRPPYPPLETQETPPHQIVPHYLLDSYNENLPEKSIHRKYASRPGGRPRRVFCCADAAKTPSPACEDGDANCRLQKRAAIVSRLFFTMKIPTPTCGGGDDLSQTAQWGCGEQIVGQITNPPDPIINAQRDGVVRKASWTRTRCRTRRNSETAARWFLSRLLEPLLKRAIACSTYGTTHAGTPLTTSRSKAIAAAAE
jgi:hypothetical protein